MHEFTTMYHYFKGMSDLSPNKVIIEPKSLSDEDNARSFIKSSAITISTEKSKQQPQIEGYMEMNVSNDAESIDNMTLNSVTNLNYSIVDAVRSAQYQLKPLVDTQEVQKDEIVNNSNIMNNDCCENNLSLNELKITEFQYFDPNDIGKSDLFSQECSNLLENCNDSGNSNINYSLQPSNLPVKSVDLEEDYLIQPSNMPIHKYNDFNSKGDFQQMPSHKQLNVNDGKEMSHLRMSFKKKEQISECKPNITSFHTQESDNSKRSVDDELLEIITDFKNNVFTIQEVEQLVQAWKNRNDVQQSFKDKHEQLQLMRQEYDRIQQQIKAKLKRPTPFETMKKIFSRNKNLASKKGNSVLLHNEESKSSLYQTKRPISSSSIQSISSISSGRISTLSGASVGDSGTHSDSEEQLYDIATTSGNKMYKKNGLLDNYRIPPIPRPVSVASTDLHEKAIQNTVVDGHYTVFPSNIPVVNVVSDNSKQFTSNLPILGLIDENNEISNPLQSILVPKYDFNCHINENRPLMTSFQCKKPFTDNTNI